MITTHVLDVSRGRPAAGVSLALDVKTSDGDWKRLATGVTGDDGRLREKLLPASLALRGTYRITFDTAAYFRARGEECFYPEVQVVFDVRDAAEPCHVPLLVSPFGYTTYRGL